MSTVADTLEEIALDAAEQKADETVADAVVIAEQIVETAQVIAERDDDKTAALINARFDGVERSIAMIDEKINGVFDSLAILDALISEVRDMERREAEEKKDSDLTVEPEEESDPQVAVEVIAAETVEVTEPQKREEKRARKWL